MLKNSLLNLYHPSILLQKIANFSSSKKQQKNLSLIFFTYFRFVKINHKNNFQKTFSSSGLDLIHFFFCFFKHMLMGEGVGGWMTEERAIFSFYLISIRKKIFFARGQWLVYYFIFASSIQVNFVDFLKNLFADKSKEFSNLLSVFFLLFVFLCFFWFF